jgi:4-amino-4-deoxy-L-arabinose transferase-like glycosyltransferase
MKNLIIVIVASLLMGAAAFQRYSVRFDGDTIRYVDGATHLMAGVPFQNKEASYLGYVAVVAASLLTGSPLTLVAFQIVVAAIAAVALYSLALELFDAEVALMSAAIFIMNPDIAKRHVYVLTDSLYISFVVLATWVIHRAAAGSAYRILPAVPVTAFTALLRPNGWLLVPIAVIYVTWRRARRPRLALMVAILVIAAFVGVMVTLRPMKHAVDAERPDHWLRAGIVIWGYEPWKLEMPSDPSPEGGWTTGLVYVARHPVASAKLGLAHLGVELLHARPYYPIGKNALILVMYPLLYGFAAWGFVPVRSAPLARLCAVIVAAHMALVAITFADWSGRFLLYVVPLLSLFAGNGVLRLVRARAASPRHVSTTT